MRTDIRALYISKIYPCPSHPQKEQKNLEREGELNETKTSGGGSGKSPLPPAKKIHKNGGARIFLEPHNPLTPNIKKQVLLSVICLFFFWYYWENVPNHRDIVLSLVINFLHSHGLYV